MAMFGMVGLGKAGRGAAWFGRRGSQKRKENKMVYKYEWGIYRFPVSAEVVGKRCEELEKENVTLSKEALLDSARDEDDELHPLFEWNDGIAAEKYRLHQAGQVLSSLKITVIQDQEEEPKQVKAFVQVTRDAHRAVYMNTQTALKRVDTREAVLKIALQELAAFKNKYQTLSELAEVIAAIDDVLGE